MLLFCPTCSNALTIARGPPADTSATPGPHRFTCRTCPYIYVLDRRFGSKTPMAPRAEASGGAPAPEDDDVLGGEAGRGMERTQASCPSERCEGTEAFFYQMQIRSADEPMTMFLRCVKCGREWQE